MIKILLLLLVLLSSCFIYFILHEQKNKKIEREEEEENRKFVLYLLKKQELLLIKQPESTERNDCIHLNHCLETVCAGVFKDVLNSHYLSEELLREYNELIKVKKMAACPISENHVITAAQMRSSKTEQFENYVKNGGNLSFEEFFFGKCSSGNIFDEGNANHTKIDRPEYSKNDQKRIVKENTKE